MILARLLSHRTAQGEEFHGEADEHRGAPATPPQRGDGYRLGRRKSTRVYNHVCIVSITYLLHHYNLQLKIGIQMIYMYVHIVVISMPM